MHTTNFGGQARWLHLTASREEHPLKKLGLGDVESRELLRVQGTPITGAQTPMRWEWHLLPKTRPAASRPAILSWFVKAAGSSPQCSGSCPLPSPPPLSLLFHLSSAFSHPSFPFCTSLSILATRAPIGLQGPQDYVLAPIQGPGP